MQGVLDDVKQAREAAVLGNYNNSSVFYDGALSKLSQYVNHQTAEIWIHLIFVVWFRIIRSSKDRSVHEKFMATIQMLEAEKKQVNDMISVILSFKVLRFINYSLLIYLSTSQNKHTI